MRLAASLCLAHDLPLMTATAPSQILDFFLRLIGRRRQNDAPTHLDIEIWTSCIDVSQRHSSIVHAEYEPESEDNKISRNFLYKLDLDRDTASRISAGEQKQIRLCWRRQQQGPDTSPNGEPYYYEMEFGFVQT